MCRLRDFYGFFEISCQSLSGCVVDEAAGCSLPRGRALSIGVASTSSPIMAHFATRGRSDG